MKQQSDHNVSIFSADDLKKITDLYWILIAIDQKNNSKRPLNNEEEANEA